MVSSPYPDVELHWLDLSQPLDEPALDALGADERERAAAFRFDRDRIRYTRRRAHLRRLLAEVTGRPAATLRYSVNDHGRPLMSDHPGLHFSTSSSGDLGVVAISGHELGVDVEQVLPDQADHDVARRLFAVEEVAALEAVAPAEFARSFFNCWSRKEAYVKATGLGLSFPLGSFAVEVHDTPTPRLLRSTLRPDDLDTCRLASLAVPGGGAAAALVVLM
jgi:4'-phosphopantetheinyl transferase